MTLSSHEKKTALAVNKKNESFALFVVIVFVVAAVLIFVLRFCVACNLIVADRFLIRHFLRMRISDVHKPMAAQRWRKTCDV